MIEQRDDISVKRGSAPGEAPEQPALGPSVPTPSGDEARPLTRWRRIAEALEGDITEGRFAPGSALPSVVELAERFDVNRHTVRQALQHLQSRGVVSVEQGRGTFVGVRTYDYRLGRRVRFRNNIPQDEGGRPTLVTLGIETLTVKEAARLDVPQTTLAWTFRLLRYAEGTPLSTSYHRVPVHGFARLDEHLRREPSVTAAFQAAGIADYVRLSTRIQAAMPTPAEAALLRVAPNRPVLLTRGIDALTSGRPFHLTTTAFVGDRIELVWEPEQDNGTADPDGPSAPRPDLSREA